MNSWIEQHLDWRPLTAEDIAQLRELRHQIEELDDSVMNTVERIVDLDSVDLILEDSIGGWDQYGNLLAYGLNVTTTIKDVPRALLLGGVHPTHRYLRIGRSILAWQEERALEYRDTHAPGSDLWIGCYCESSQPGLQRLLQRRGFVPERLFHDMYRDLDRLPPPGDVDEITFAPWDPDALERVRRLHNQCFAKSRQTNVDSESWAESLETPNFRPAWTWLARHGDRIVGYALTREDDAPDGDSTGRQAWTDRLGVHPDYRGRGISTALLLRALRAMADDGCVRAGIGVDTTHENFLDHLEAHLGYRTRDAITLMSKTVAVAG